MIKLSKHFIARVEERFNSNNWNKQSFILETFKNTYKKWKKKKIHPKIEKADSKYWEVFKMYYQEFRFVFSVDQGDITLITFTIRSKEPWVNNFNY